mgnify:CR=1 FL=1
MNQIVCVLYCGEYITRLNRFLERCLIIPGNVGWSRACNDFGHLLYISSFSKSFIYCIIINKTGSYALNNAKILTYTINSRQYTVENRNADQMITWLLANVPNTQSKNSHDTQATPYTHTPIRIDYSLWRGRWGSWDWKWSIQLQTHSGPPVFLVPI